MINTTSFVNAIEKVKHQLRIDFDLRTEQMMALNSTVASREKDCLLEKSHLIFLILNSW